MVGINIVTVRYIIVNVMINSDQHIALFKEVVYVILKLRNNHASFIQLCPSCNWIDSDRNFGVIPVESAKVEKNLLSKSLFAK